MGTTNLRLIEILLGLKITDDKDGILQDVHWAAGNFGYFPGLCHEFHECSSAGGDHEKRPARTVPIDVGSEYVITCGDGNPALHNDVH